MTLLEKSLKRRSYRKFTNKEVDDKIIEECLMIASSAPSGANMQPYHYCVVKNKELKKEIRVLAQNVEKSFYETKITENWKKDLEKLEVNYNKPFLEEANFLIICFKQNYRIEDNIEKPNYYVNESTNISIGFLINALNEFGISSLTYTPSPNTFLIDLFKVEKNYKPVMILACGYPDLDYKLPKLNKKKLEEFSTFYK